MVRMQRALAHLSWWIGYHAALPSRRTAACRERSEDEGGGELLSI